MINKKLLNIGFIKNTHGIKGEFELKLTTFINLNKFIGKNIFLFYEKIYIPFEIENVFLKKNNPVLKIKDIDDINKVIKYIKHKVFISILDINDCNFKLEKNIIGYNVINFETKNIIGEVISVNFETKNKIILYLDKKSNKNVMIPFVDEFVLNVDHKSENIEVKLIKGL